MAQVLHGNIVTISKIKVDNPSNWPSVIMTVPNETGVEVKAEAYGVPIDKQDASKGYNDANLQALLEAFNTGKQITYTLSPKKSKTGEFIMRVFPNDEKAAASIARAEKPKDEFKQVFPDPNASAGVSGVPGIPGVVGVPPNASAPAAATPPTPVNPPKSGVSAKDDWTVKEIVPRDAKDWFYLQKEAKQEAQRDEENKTRARQFYHQLMVNAYVQLFKGGDPTTVVDAAIAKGDELYQRFCCVGEA